MSRGRSLRPSPARSRGEDAGFSLVELLVAMGVLGILAAIAIPLVSDQRGKAVDTATRSDAGRLAKEVTSWFMEQASAPALTIAAGRFSLAGNDVGAASPGVVIAGADAATVDTTGWTSLAWCFNLTNPSGSTKTFRYSAQKGLEAGACTSSTAP